MQGVLLEGNVLWVPLKNQFCYEPTLVLKGLARVNATNYLLLEVPGKYQLLEIPWENFYLLIIYDIIAELA